MSEDHFQSLERQLKVIKDRVRGVVHGISNGMYIYGRPGTSKTHTVRTTLETLGASYQYQNGHITPIGMFDTIASNRDRIIVLDDVSSIFNQPIALQILLGALGNTHDGSNIRWVSYKTAKGDQSVPFTGGIICISNLPLTGHNKEVLAALNDRVNSINYDPSDEQMEALIFKIAESGVGGVATKKAKMVATYLIEQSKLRSIRPSVRLFVDKAIKDFILHEAGLCETHWKDLIVSNLEEQLIDLKHPVNDLSRADQTAAERRIALEIYLAHSNRAERIAAWNERTRKGQSAFYRRLDELKRSGKLPDSAA